MLDLTIPTGAPYFKSTIMQVQLTSEKILKQFYLRFKHSASISAYPHQDTELLQVLLFMLFPHQVLSLHLHSLGYVLCRVSVFATLAFVCGIETFPMFRLDI